MGMKQGSAMTCHGLNIPDEGLANFCTRWRIVELAVFGSILRNDFRRDSDVDVLVRWADDTKWSLLDQVRMQDELTALLGRKVDLVSRRAVERSTNWIRRTAILESAEVIYAA
ncbi:MAG: nucleotidyltransferase domain-containing protein [Planctomycetota bacterium]|nr:nucleotidyltransferase domain-containing protein [Planctomycetota bacterium]